MRVTLHVRHTNIVSLCPCHHMRAQVAVAGHRHLLLKFLFPAMRVAVVAFVAAVGAELATGKTIVEQFQQAPALIIGVSALFAVATLIVSVSCSLLPQLTGPHDAHLTSPCMASTIATVDVSDLHMHFMMYQI